jgi:AcrR family transcriptional regulator
MNEPRSCGVFDPPANKHTALIFTALYAKEIEGDILQLNTTLEKIFETAQALFIEKGYANVTVQDICDACGLTKTAFYYHLKSKEDIILHMYDPITESIAHKLVPILDAENHWEQLMLCFEHLIEGSEKYGTDVCRQVLISNLKNDKGSYDFREDLTKVAISIIKHAQAAGQIRNSSPADALYEASAYAFLGYEVTWCIKSGSIDRKKEVRRAMENIFDVAPDLRMK